MRISSYLVIWLIGHICGLCDVMNLMLWLFTSFSYFYAGCEHEWCKWINDLFNTLIASAIILYAISLDHVF